MKTPKLLWFSAIFCTVLGLFTACQKEKQPSALMLGQEAFQNRQYDQALEWLLPLALKEDIEAQVIIAQMYREGHAVKKNDQASQRWYKRAADLGHRDAQLITGKLFLESAKSKEQYKIALDYLEKAANQGELEAHYLAAEVYLNVDEIPTDLNKAFEYLYFAAKKGEVNSQFRLAQMIEAGFEPEIEIVFDSNQKNTTSQRVYQLDPLYWYQLAADQKHLASNLYLAKYFESKKPADLIESHYFYKKAAELGNYQAQVKVAQNYENGVGVIQDWQQALFWYKKAAKMHEPKLLYHLALKRAQDGRPHKQALTLIKQAAQTGVKEAQNIVLQSQSLTQKNLHSERNQPTLLESEIDFTQLSKIMKGVARKNAKDTYQLALAYWFGHPEVNKNKLKAIEWLKKAGHRGHLKAMLVLGIAYFEKGSFLKQNLENAQFWFEKSYKINKEPLAAYYLGLLHFKNNQNSLAITYLEEAANAGLNQAILELALYYHSQIESNKTPNPHVTQKAFEWVQKAALTGSLRAQTLLVDYYLNGVGTTKNMGQVLVWQLYLQNKNGQTNWRFQ